MNNSFQQHPKESVILRFLDGELTERETSGVRSHLNGCWQCRRNLGEWQGTIDAFLRLRENVIFPAYPPPSQPWQDVSQFCPAPPVSTPSRWWHILKFAGATTIAAAVFAAIVVWRHPEPDVLPTGGKSTSPSLKGAGSAPSPAIDKTGPAHAAIRAPAVILSLKVRAAKTLHELGADLGEPVEIVATATRVIVRAHGLEPRRRRTIAAAISRLPDIGFEAGEPPSAPAPQTPPTAVQRPRPKSFEARLTSLFGSPAALESFVNQVLDYSDSISARAHALQSLELLFPNLAALSPPDRATIDSIAATHRAILREHAQALRTRLQPVLEVPPGPAMEAASLTARAVELDRLLNAAFAGAQLPLSDAALAARIQSLLQSLIKDLDR